MTRFLFAFLLLAVSLSSCMKVDGLPSGTLNSKKTQDDSDLAPIRKVRSTEGTIYWVVDLRKDVKVVASKSYELNSATSPTVQTFTNYTYSPGIEQQVERSAAGLYRTQVKSIGEFGRTIFSVTNLVQSPTPEWVGATEIQSYQYDAAGNITSNRFRRLLADGSIQSETNSNNRYDEKRRLVWHRDEGIRDGQPTAPVEYVMTFNEADKTAVRTFTTIDNKNLINYFFFVNGYPAASAASWSAPGDSRTTETSCDYDETIESYKCTLIGRIPTQTNIALKIESTFKIVQFIYPDRTEIVSVPTYRKGGQFFANGNEVGSMQEVTYNAKFQKIQYRSYSSNGPRFVYELTEESTYEYDSLGVNLMRKVRSVPAPLSTTTETYSLQ